MLQGKNTAISSCGQTNLNFESLYVFIYSYYYSIIPISFLSSLCMGFIPNEENKIVAFYFTFLLWLVYSQYLG